MAIQISAFGTLNEEEVKKITITDETGCAVSVLTLGAVIQSFIVPVGEEKRNIVFSSPSLEGYIDDPSYKGQCVAPYANRIAFGRFVLDGKEYTLEKNNGENNLHSGSANLGQKIWNILFQTENSVVLNTEHRDMEGGFPGNIGVTVAYLLEKGRLTISYTMQSDRKCVVNPTNHSYFNLKGDGSSIFDHRVQISADRAVMVSDSLIPTDAVSVYGTDFDFTSFHSIGERRDGKYDNAFILSDDAPVVLENEEYILRMRTSAPAVQLYTGEYLEKEGHPEAWCDVGKFGGVCLESEYYPDFPNHGDYSGAYSIPGLVSRLTTTYRLGKK